MILSEIRAQGWKYGAFALFVALSASVIYGLWQRGAVAKAESDRKVAEVEHKAEVDRYELRQGELLAVIEGYKAQEARFASLVKAEAEKLEAAREESAEATKAAETAKANAAKSEAGWMRQYAKRPESCKVALEALEVACASYSPY